MKRWKQKQTGFTIVELLIVVVVIAILAAITVVSYNGIQQSAKESQFVSAMNAYVKGARLYYSANKDTHPSTDTACFDGTACWSGVTSAGSQALRTELGKVMGSLPSFPDSSYIGLYVPNGTVGSYAGTYILYQYPDSGSCKSVAGARLLNQSISGGLRTCRAAIE